MSIKLENVDIRFGNQTVLEKIHLHIQDGERAVLIGPSGQGKSVLLKTMATLIPPSSGKVYIQGKELHHLVGNDKVELLNKIGMLFQKNALFDSLTCGDNIAFPLRETTTLDEDAIKNKVEQFLGAVGILHAKDLYPDEISGGMQKRLGIARALALSPEVIFYDDPTAGLDPITSRKIIELILSLQIQKNSTIVAVVNDMNRAYQLADRIFMVIDKEVIDAGTKEEILNHKDQRIYRFVRGLSDD